MPSNLPRVLIRLTPDQHRQLTEYAASKQLSLNDVVRDALVAQDIIQSDIIQHGGLRVSLHAVDILTDYGRNDPTE